MTYLPSKPLTERERTAGKQNNCVQLGHITEEVKTVVKELEEEEKTLLSQADVRQLKLIICIMKAIFAK